MNYNVVKVKNLTDKDFEFMFDGHQFKCPAGSVVDLPEDAARHGVARSLRSLDPFTGKATYQLAICGEGDTDTEVTAKAPDEELLEIEDKERKKVFLTRAQLTRPVEEE